MLATGILFHRDRKGRPIRHAKIFQDILRFSLDFEEDNKFNQKELSVWLVNNSNTFEFESRTPTKTKSYKVLREIEPLLRQLIKLGLISQIGLEREKNGTNEFALLKYTAAGRLLALIINNSDLDKRIKDNHKIYDILRTYHSSNKSSGHQFLLQLLTLYHEQDRLDDLTEIVRKILERVAYVPCTDLLDIYEVVGVIYFSNLEKAKVFINNWKTAMNNLEPFLRNLFLYNIKLEYEARMADHRDLGDPILYEEYRFKLRGNSEETALQAKCIRCNIVQNLSDKTSKVVVRDFNRPLDIKCPSCNNLNCLVIPSL